MARGIGGYYGMDQGANPARGAFTSQQPVSPMGSAPQSPLTGSTAGVSAGGDGTGDQPLPSMMSAASPTYGRMSAGAVVNSNRI